MIIRDFYDVIIATLNRNIYSIQLNLVLVQADTLVLAQVDTVQKFSVVAQVLQLAVLRFISNFFGACVQNDTCKFSKKISFTGLSTKSCTILPIFILS